MLAGAWRATTGPRKNTDSPREAVTEGRRKGTAGSRGRDVDAENGGEILLRDLL
ncbi:MAG: hypothetical protein RLZZ253_2420, partial [Verrucomicrobiota bacterium]